MGPRELVLNPEVSAWRHPDGAVKANRLPPRATTAGAPDCCSSNRLAVSFAGAAAAPLAAPLATGAPSFLRAPCSPRGFDDFSVIVSRAGADAAGAAVGNLAWTGTSASR